MASNQEFVNFVLDQIRGLETVTSRKMFGEYAVYFNGKVIALICDDQLFVKPTPEGASFIGEPIMAPPYPGAKPYFLIEEQLDDREFLMKLFDMTEAVLPVPKKKPNKKIK